ncbi:right-handed parallel beta-helix repeat-containing protein [bacterium]|nr:right-handed parallel beta-helix repeat-containing protein [bacterium]
MQIRLWIPVALAALIALTAQTTARAATFTVSSGGSIATALGAASSGDSVLVQEGSYPETISLVSGVTLLGGYDGSFTDRNPAARLTVIDGGGVAPAVISGPSVSASTRVDGFVITGGSGDGGAGILVTGGAPVFSNNDIRENRDGVAGGAHVHSGSTAMFLGNRFRNNRSAGSGGGMRVENSAVTLIDNSFQANIAPNAGGGLYLFQSDVQCSSNTFRSCRAGEGGGGLYLQRVGIGARIVDTDFLYCEAGEMGGGAHAKNGTDATLERSSFRFCRATNGGAIAATSGADLTLTECIIENCTADNVGGGVWALASTLVFLGQDVASSPTSRIENCTAGIAGGGAAADSCTGTIDNVRVTNCSSTEWGGGLYILHSSFTVSLSIVEGCVSGEGGGIAFRTELANKHRRSNLYSCTIWGCSSTDGGSPPAGGGVTLASYGNTANVATCVGSVVAGTLAGSAVRCRRGGAAAGAGLPIFSCSTFHADAGNPVSLDDVVAGNRCDDAFTNGAITVNQEGVDPLYCQPIVSYQLQSTSPVVGNNCNADKQDRGAQPDGNYCPGTTVSLEATSWGRLKAAYR